MKKFAVVSILAVMVLGGCTDKFKADLRPVAAPTQIKPRTAVAAVDKQGNVTRFVDTVHFETGSALIGPEARETLMSQAAWLLSHPDVSATVEGNCDYRDTEAYNLRLGMDRAVAVRSVLVAAGVQAKRLTVVSNGKSNPLSTGTDEVSLALNRRVVTVRSPS